MYWSAVAPPLIMKESKRLARMGHIESKFCSWLSLLQLPMIGNCRSVAEFFRGWNLIITSEIKAVLSVNADVMTQQRREKPQVFLYVGQRKIGAPRLSLAQFRGADPLYAMIPSSVEVFCRVERNSRRATLLHGVSPFFTRWEDPLRFQVAAALALSR